MPDYGKAEYWNKRYLDEALMEPFDWLFTYDDIALTLEELIPMKSCPILMVGAGNAPFSCDMYHKGGFTNICNIDLSDVVIDVQKAKYPEQQWLVMDVRQTCFHDGEYPLIIDKSLIDTMVCYENGVVETQSMLKELYRVLKPGGRLITFSLHPMDNVVTYFHNFDWEVHAYRIKSSRWNNTEAGRKRSIAQTMVVCDKHIKDNKYNVSNNTIIDTATTYNQFLFPSLTDNTSLSGVLNEEEYYKLKQVADEVNLKAALRYASEEDLILCLQKALQRVY